MFVIHSQSSPVGVIHVRLFQAFVGRHNSVEELVEKCLRAEKNEKSLGNVCNKGWSLSSFVISFSTRNRRERNFSEFNNDVVIKSALDSTTSDTLCHSPHMAARDLFAISAIGCVGVSRSRAHGKAVKGYWKRSEIYWIVQKYFLTLSHASYLLATGSFIDVISSDCYHEIFNYKSVFVAVMLDQRRGKQISGKYMKKR